MIRKCIRCGDEAPVHTYVDDQESWPVCSDVCEEMLRGIIASWMKPYKDPDLVDEQAPF